MADARAKAGAGSSQSSNIAIKQHNGWPTEWTQEGAPSGVQASPG